MSLNINPEEYFFRHKLRTAPSLNINLNINFEGEWFLVNDPSMLFVLDGANIPEISGSGQRTVPIKLTNDVNFFDEGIYEMKLRVFSLGEMQEKTLTVFLMVAYGGGSLILPEKLNFSAVRNVEIASSQKVYVASDSSINVILPPWLELESNIGTGHVFQIKPVAHENTPNKFYSGNIIFELGSRQEVIPVSYKINAGYDEAYTKPVHFTRDNDEMIFYKTIRENSFLKLMIDVKSFDHLNRIHREFTLDLDLPFTGNMAKINLGEEIEPYFFNDIPFVFNSTVSGVYPPLELRITALEVNNIDYSTLNLDVLPLQYYLRGRKPVVSQDYSPFWLDFQSSIERLVSNQATIALSVFKPDRKTIPNIDMFINGEHVDSFDRFPQLTSRRPHPLGVMKPYFCTVMIDLNRFVLNEGDEITFTAKNVPGKRSFIIRPNVKRSLSIAYLTSWNTYEIIEFTGGISFEVDYTHEVFDSLRNYQSVVEKINTENPQKAIINSGWIQKSEAFLIDQLIQSKRAYLLSEMSGLQTFSSEKIELVPIQQKITNFNSETNMYQFDIEFLINPDYENKIYSR